jgi:phage gpG-like protein
MTAKWQRFSVTPPPDFTPAMRQSLGKEVAEFIRQRTEKGLDINGKKWKGPAGKYSDAYKESLDFKNAGKTSKVDLTLSGDMLIALDMISEKKDKIIIGYKNGSEENAKADGNVRGTYGQKKANPSKARNFMGISDKDLDNLIDKVRENYDADT